MSTPMHLDPIPFITLPSWIKAATRCGFNIEPVLREAGIEIDAVHVESTTVGPLQLAQVMSRCVALSRREPPLHFPFVVGETFAFDYLPEIETFLSTSPTLREALRVFDWVRELINPMIDIRVDESPDEVSLYLSETPADGDAVMALFTEATMASVVKFGRGLMPQAIERMRLDFRHRAPPYVERYAEHFGCPIRFSQPRTQLILDRLLLDVPLDSAFPALHRQAQSRVEQRLTNLPKRAGLVAAIERSFIERPALLSQGIERLSEALKLHPRTLQRRLRSEGQHYADLQDRARFRLASQWLADPQLPIETISERLGYSDRRSFTRAFTRWSGLSPSAFREREPEP
jgi:AraC-like DNA-binding protein